LGQIFQSFETNNGAISPKMIEKSSQNGFPAVGFLFSDSLLALYQPEC